jgi:hypothetical protein
LIAIAALVAFSMPVRAASNHYWDWDAFTKMTMRECMVTIDATLAKHEEELDSYVLFHACDQLTKGYPTATINTLTRPRQGTAARERMDKCIREYNAQTPLLSRSRPPQEVLELVCQ